jgi:2-polyprenyl-3-methyl-5-hydroxy-6-metoxy-1,4-benzoquinol methylase
MTDPAARPVGLDEAYAISTPEDSRRLYARWAATYDADFVERERYVYPRTVAALVAKALATAPPGDGPRDASSPTVVDVGCGTGALGETLAALRPDAAIDGLDISPEMLAVARAKRRADGAPLYRALIVADLAATPAAAPLASLTGRYDVVTSVGTFTHGHLGPEVLATVVALARSGGRLVVGINEAHFDARGFAATLAALIADGAVRDATTTRVPIYLSGSPHAADTALVLTATACGPVA